MAKKQSVSLVQGKHLKKNVKRTLKSKIDFSDIPELTDKELSKARRVGRPNSDNPKQLIAFRIDPRLLNKLKKLANLRNKPYQTLLHELLELAVRKAA